MFPLITNMYTLYSQFGLRLMDALQLDLQVSLTRILPIAGSESRFSLTFKAELGKPDRFRPEILSSNIHHLNISFSGYTVIKRAQYKGFAPSSKIILDFFAWHYACIYIIDICSCTTTNDLFRSLCIVVNGNDFASACSCPQSSDCQV